MSETENAEPATVADVPEAAVEPVAIPEAPRPWHGAVNPFEGLFAHFTAEIAALRTEIMDLMGGTKADQKAASAAHTEEMAADPAAE